MRSFNKWFILAVVPMCAAAAGCAIEPSALSDEQLFNTGTANAERVASMQEPIYGAITLHEAIARALKFNLDHRVEMMTQALKRAEERHAAADMLPQLVAEAGYSGRNNELIVSSVDLPTGLEFEPNTISQEKEFKSGDVTFSWDILDFALSYVRARQASDHYLIATEVRRKAVHRIIEDTRTAYWRAASADRMGRKLAKMESRVRGAISGSRAGASDGSQSALTALAYERELVEIKRTAEQLEHEMNLAKAQLASLMNVAPGTKFTVADHGPQSAPAIINMAPQEMVAEAIFNRAEIREVAYERRIQEHEAVAAILELLPNVKEYGMEAFNDNRFLLHNNWLAWGTTIAGNLMKVVRLPETSALIEAEGAVIETQALAITMAVMTQVYVSRTRYAHYLNELDTAKQYAEVQATLVEQLRAQSSAGKIGEQTLIREEMNLLVAEIERDVAIANLESAAANLLVTMGLDLQPEDVPLEIGVRELAGQLKARWADRVALSDRGKYLLELQRAQEEARRKKEEEERRVREEQRRIAEEEQRRKDEEIRLAKEEAKRIADEAAAAKAEQQRLVMEEAARLKAEAALAKKLADQERAEQARIAKLEAQQRQAEAEEARAAAKRARAETLRIAHDDARAAKLEAERVRGEERREAELTAKQMRDEARRAKQEDVRAEKAEVGRLREEARIAREDARRARREAISTKRGKTGGSEASWEWVWPWEESGSAKKARKPKRQAQAISGGI